MKMSDKGLALTQQFEGLSLTAYRDVVGVWTNGYGNTHGVVPGSKITPEQAVADLRRNIASAESTVSRLVTVSLTQGQFDALVDFVFNLGEGNFAQSTLLKKLNMGDYVGAASEFPRWNRAGGKVVDGLSRRRNAEMQLFNSK